jgi:two-component system phosphate regulon response regulator PhoB
VSGDAPLDVKELRAPVCTPQSDPERADGRRPARRTVLIADDEPSMRLLVTATIASDQIEVLEAADGDQAWELIEQRRPDLVLLDVQMPGLTGIDLARNIRADPALSVIRVVLLTSKAQAGEVATGLEAGADLYLTKPFSPLSLLNYVEQSLGL